MKNRTLKPGDIVMSLNDNLKRMKVVDYVVNTQKVDNWQYFEYPIWQDDVLVECTFPDKFGLPFYNVFNEEDLILVEDKDRLGSDEYLQNFDRMHN